VGVRLEIVIDALALRGVDARARYRVADTFTRALQSATLWQAPSRQDLPAERARTAQVPVQQMSELGRRAAIDVVDVVRGQLIATSPERQRTRR